VKKDFWVGPFRYVGDGGRYGGGRLAMQSTGLIFCRLGKSKTDLAIRNELGGGKPQGESRNKRGESPQLLKDLPV